MFKKRKLISNNSRESNIRKNISCHLSVKNDDINELNDVSDRENDDETDSSSLRIISKVKQNQLDRQVTHGMKINNDEYITIDTVDSKRSTVNSSARGSSSDIKFQAHKDNSYSNPMEQVQLKIMETYVATRLGVVGDDQAKERVLSAEDELYIIPDSLKV
jgi:hypothetical protein